MRNMIRKVLGQAIKQTNDRRVALNLYTNAAALDAGKRNDRSVLDSLDAVQLELWLMGYRFIYTSATDDPTENFRNKN